MTTTINTEYEKKLYEDYQNICNALKYQWFTYGLPLWRLSFEDKYIPPFTVAISEEQYVKSILSLSASKIQEYWKKYKN